MQYRVVKSRDFKGILKVFVRQKRGTFFGKEVLRKCAKSHAKKECRRESVLSKKIMPIIYIKGGIMKHPCMAMFEATIAKVIRDGV
jgi:hypothetical protein